MEAAVELMLSILPILFGGLCCLAFVVILGGVAFWFLRRNKDDGDTCWVSMKTVSGGANFQKLW